MQRRPSSEPNPRRHGRPGVQQQLHHVGPDDSLCRQMQRRPSSEPNPRRHGRPVLQQQLHHGRVACRCRLMQRRPSVLIPGLHVRPVLQQHRHDSSTETAGLRVYTFDQQK